MDYYALDYADDHTDAIGAGEVFPCPSCGALLPEPEMRRTHPAESYPQASPPEYEPVDETVRCPRCGKEVLLR